MASPAVYIFRTKDLHYFNDFLDAMKERPLSEKDAPGKLISWMINMKKVVFHVFNV